MLALSTPWPRTQFGWDQGRILWPAHLKMTLRFDERWLAGTLLSLSGLRWRDDLYRIVALLSAVAGGIVVFKTIHRV